VTQALQQKVLLAVPDARTYLPIESALIQAGFEITIASSSGRALKLITAEKPDFIIIDKAIPHMGGIRLSRRIRMDQDLAHTRIIMLIIAQDLVKDAAPTDVGADDYLLKPFDMEDLLTRIAALQHALKKERMNEVLKAGTIKMVPDQWVVYVDDELVDLTEIEYRLLLELLMVKGRVLTRDTLMERVWGHKKAHNVETRTLDVHMSRLRHKLGISAENIITVRNVGYRIKIAPSWLNQNQ
jgi:two-component system alkaline phosphatase synthesis response regulator PhoP